ncbi:hypothetical protein JHK87_014442 [Glycine soja]|nr:hypothetical protein JHK87_014442 [Glycine soja]
MVARYRVQREKKKKKNHNRAPSTSKRRICKTSIIKFESANRFSHAYAYTF